MVKAQTPTPTPTQGGPSKHLLGCRHGALLLLKPAFLFRRRRKQLNRYKHKLQGTYTLQEEQNGRFETKIRELTANQDNLWTKLQQMRRDLQVQIVSAAGHLGCLEV